MRTLKKTLALVLVVAMMMSLCITSNAAFTDADEIEYVEAVEVMTAIGVIDGFPAGDFQPQGSLTRAQAAKILVYILGEENYAKADGQIFDDVAPTHWAADYIAYCAENGLVDGYGNGKFGPEDKLTGYQWAKMLLAALGVDTTEMIGAAWQIPVAQAAASLGIFSGNMAADKTEICTREEACLYALNALKHGDVAAGYAVYMKNETLTKADDLIVEVYPSVTDAAHAAAALNDADDVVADMYYITGVVDGYYLDGMLWTIHRVSCYSTRDHWGRPATAYACRYWAAPMVYLDTPVAVYTTAVTECDIAVDLGLKGDKDITFAALNGDEVAKVDDNKEIDLLGTKAYIGAQGRATEIYSNGIGGYEVIQIDQFLAKVLRVVDATYDKAGHMATTAKLYLAVYDQNTNDGSVDAENYTTVILESYANYTYARGDMLLVNFDDDAKDYLEIVAYADSITGKQTKLTTKSSHVVEGEEYMDAIQFNLDEAGNQTGEHTWYFDTYGNLIGVVDVADVYTFGTITSIYWKDSNNGDNGYAVADITYMDGKTVEDVVVYSINGDVLRGVEGTGSSYADGLVSSTKQYNNGYALTSTTSTADFTNVALYKIVETPYGLVLTDTTYVEDVTLNEGVTCLKANKLYADKNTVFLIWDETYEEYEVIVGVQNLPDYYGTPDVWAAELETGKDTDAEYVFVNDPYVVKTSYALYFNGNVSADVESDLYWDAQVLHTVGGGILNHVADSDVVISGFDASFRSNAVWQDLKAAEGQLAILTLQNGYVIDAEIIDDEIYTDNATKTYAEYIGVYGVDVKANAIETILKETDGTSYDISGITEIFGAKDWTSAAGKYIWVVYSTNYSNAKTAVYVYASDVAPLGVVKDAALAAIDAYAAATVGSNWMKTNYADVVVTVNDIQDAIDALYADVEACESAAEVAAIDYVAALDAATVAAAKAKLAAREDGTIAAEPGTTQAGLNIEAAWGGLYTNLAGVVFNDTLELKLYSGDTLMAESYLAPTSEWYAPGGPSNWTANFVIDGENDETWPTTWYDMTKAPTHYEVWCDGVMMFENSTINYFSNVQGVSCTNWTEFLASFAD